MTKPLMNILALIDPPDEPDTYFHPAIGIANMFDCHLHVLLHNPERVSEEKGKQDKYPIEKIWMLQNFYSSYLKSRLRTNLLAQDLGCPVILLPKNGEIRKLRNIFLPVQQALPAGKMVIAVRLARKFNAKIHLVGTGSRGISGEDDVQTLYCHALRQDRWRVRSGVYCWRRLHAQWAERR